VSGEPTPASITAGAAAVRERIVAAGGDPDAVTILAVTKGHPVAAVRAALAAGFTALGENYAQELVAKAEELGPAPVAPEWHFIGQLQANKVRSLAPHVALWQSVDRPRLLQEVARRQPGGRVLVQVNVSGEPQQGGCAPAEVADLVRSGADLGLHVEGLMGIASQGPPDRIRADFAAVRRIAEEHELTTLSMGMSDDLEIAVQEGSTMVRVGTALFGHRPPRADKR
jgi:pyridoxal phosphate enzyme (YggS family)